MTRTTNDGLAAGAASPQPAGNRRILLAARPNGVPGDGCWRIEDAAVTPPGAGEALVAVSMLSLDPAMRGWMNEGRSYIAPVALGDVMRASGIGTVIASGDPALAPGTMVAGELGVQQYATRPVRALTAVDPRLAPPEKWLNPLGMPGMTAYFGLLDVGAPQPGQTVVVSGAAGAVGQTVGQIAKIHGCRAVGIAGGQAKCDFVAGELGFDACIDYKAGDLKAALRTHCPDGVDVYFDNVGGEILDTVLTRLARGARIVICGAISQYNNTEPVRGPANYLSLLVNRARMQGMVVFDYAARYPEAVHAIAGWMQAGRLRSREDVVAGLETFPERLRMLFSGANFGKLVLKVDAPA
ncbi:MAG: NADP-dependent oxidoreductase [Lautropia sp.]